MASRTRFLGLLSWVKSICFQSYVSSLSEYSQIDTIGLRYSFTVKTMSKHCCGDGYGRCTKHQPGGVVRVFQMLA